MTTENKVIKHISLLCSSKNQWHDGAVCSHILATIGSKWYRQMLDWIISNQLIHFKIDDYVKVAKMSHEIIRRTGIAHDG